MIKMSYRERSMEIKRKYHIRYQSMKTSREMAKTLLELVPVMMVIGIALKFLNMEEKKDATNKHNRRR